MLATGASGAQAEAAYKSCLSDAARYVERHFSTSGEIGGVIAPMCYPQFLAMDRAATAPMSRSDRRRFDRDNDRRQLEYAQAAIAAQRRTLALSNGQ